MGRKKTNEEFVEEVYELVGEEYIFLEEYADSNTKIKCRHNICKHEWDVQPRHFLNSGSRCPICSNKNRSILQIKTNETFIEEVYNLVGNEYTFLEKYINNKTKIKCRHNTCGYEWMASPSGFTSNGTRCPKCAEKRVGEKRRKTNEEFIKEVYDLVGDEYIFVEEYVNANTKIKCKHNECGYEWHVLPNNFLRGQRCPNHRITTNEEFTTKVKELVGDEYVFLEAYADTKTKIKCKHNIKECGHEYYVAPNKFLQGRRCPECNSPNYNRDTKQFKQEIFDLVRYEYNVLSEYKDAKTKVKFKHNKVDCGHEWYTTPTCFLAGHRCPQCGIKKQAENNTKTNKEFIREVFKLTKNEYTFLEEYKGANTKILCKHNKNTCNHEWDITPSNFLRGKRCPKCLFSSGERTIDDILNGLNIKLIPQHTFKDCRNKYVLPFDFYLPNYNLLIEYDGRQHFEPIEFFGGQEQLEYQQQNDNIKNQYCKKNNIPLLRIPYWEFENVEEILFKKLNELKVGEEEWQEIS